ncbi:hypothetical protein BCE_0643 [Bacillus cereus ATCC 10987]|uniref:Uncharacterized protein n=1 Tax=Bacillus cereus (strain ATCC 10987 / NRS 248) TaxID=222523 RepID=Q73DR9_BACC1|nr:hypothetical protein BCE_0643 [Bacillus cereus ATCC 10987]
MKKCKIIYLCFLIIYLIPLQLVYHLLKLQLLLRSLLSFFSSLISPRVISYFKYKRREILQLSKYMT